MTARRPVIASWADTGRFVGSPQRERERDLQAAADDMEAGRPVRPLLAAWLSAAFRERDRISAGMGRADLDRLLGLRTSRPSGAHRRAMQRERHVAIRKVADALSAPSTTALAGLVIALLHDHSLPGPPEARGALALLRDKVFGKLPRSEKTIIRAINKAPLDKLSHDVVSKK